MNGSLPDLLEIVDEDWPKRFELPDGHSWRSMLPSGMHCDRCHALITVEEANIGCDPRRGFRSVFETQLVVDLLAAHVDFVCRAGVQS